jgi:hypothetical protein
MCANASLNQTIISRHCQLLQRASFLVSAGVDSSRSTSVDKLISSERHGPARSLINSDALLRRLAAKLLSRAGHAENHKAYTHGRLRKGRSYCLACLTVK